MFNKTKFGLLCMTASIAAMMLSGCGSAQPVTETVTAEESSIAKEEQTEKASEVTAAPEETAPAVSEEAASEAKAAVPADTSGLSIDWKSCQFMLNEQLYSLCFDYADLESEGWSFDLAEYGYEGGYTMNAHDKVTGTIYLTNNTYDSDVIIGFENTSEESKDITECQIWSIEVVNSRADKPVSFTLPCSITNGSTFDDIKAAYGEPTETYEPEDVEYSVYTYYNDFTQKLRLQVFDDGGLKDFTYEIYN